MIFCENCGKQLNEEQKSCHGCGTAVGGSWQAQQSASSSSAHAAHNTTTDYERNKLYFFPTPAKKLGWKPFALIAIAILFFILAQQVGYDLRVFFNIMGGILVGAGIIWTITIFSINENREAVEDEEYDAAVNNKFRSIDIMQVALEKVGIDEDQLKEIPPVFFHGYRSDMETAKKIGKDGKLRTSKYDATILFFSNAQIFMYQQVFDMIEGIKLEYTREYFYKDIVSFYTSTETSDKNKKEVKGVSTFYLTVPNDKFYCSMSNVSDAEMIIGAMKQMLREKKA